MNKETFYEVSMTKKLEAHQKFVTKLKTVIRCLGKSNMIHKDTLENLLLELGEGLK